MSRAEAAGATWLLGKFALGYLAVLAAPGPNMLAIGALAALRGFRAVLPFCLGVAIGVMALAAALQLAFGAVSERADIAEAARAIGGVLLLVVALRIALCPPPRRNAAAARSGPAGEWLLALLAGLCTAATNPITAGYFAAQMLGPLAALPMRWATIPLVGLLALGFGLLVAGLFAHPAARQRALRHHRAACLASGAALAGLAAVILAPLVAA